jgi:integral membrane protein (TIGR01906 family)
VRFEYGTDLRPAVPILPGERRRELALLGLRAVIGPAGVDLLRRERVFGERELRHMEDVRSLLGVLFDFHLGAGLALAALAAGLAAGRAWRLLARLLLAAGLATLALAAVVGILLVADFGTFFEGFHRLLFPGLSWKFPDSAPLIQIYPRDFWNDTALILAGATVVQAAVAAALGWWLRRRAL